MARTLAALQAGSTSIKWVVLIEGCKYVPSDAPESAVQTALAGTDWASAEVINGLFVTMQNSQSIDPGSVFGSNSRCVLRVIDTDGADTFGTFINKRMSGAETEITATVDRNDTTINVKSTTGFASSGEVHIGTECIGYTGITATSFTGCTRGKYSPIGCDSSGSGGSRFAAHHRFGVDSRYVQRQPVVTQLPRVWLGKRVSVYLHTWDGSALNVRSDAQLVFAGRIVGIADDPDTFHTVIDVEHYSAELKNGVIGRDLWTADISPGIWLATGRKFSFYDSADTTIRIANELDVVASGASGSNQMNEGFYSLAELCEKLNVWLAGELAAARIFGSYSWDSPVSYRGDGLRTVCKWIIQHASDVKTRIALGAPTEVMGFLGLTEVEPTQNGQMTYFVIEGMFTNENNLSSGAAVPFTSVIFNPTGPGRIAQEFSEAVNYDVENERGTFQDQRSLLPSAVSDICKAGHDWGIFLLDDKALMVASYNGTGRLTNCWLAPYANSASNQEEPLYYIGRRADEPQAPVTVRQVFMFEGAVGSIINTLVYSTGASGYNHGTYDTLPSGLGLGMPGGLLGGEFERSLASLPGAEAPIVIVIDEPTKFSDLIESDLQIRRGFLRWKDQGFEVGKWESPVLGRASTTLSESNKAAPSGMRENHRTALEETDEYQRTSVKIDYARDFAVGRDGRYLKSISIEDQAATDDSGNGGTGGRSVTLKMRNTFASFASTGAALESLLPEYMATMPMFSQAGRRLTRTIDLTHFEGLSVGDIVQVEDSFARDPITGQRGIGARAAVVTRHSCDYGGPNADGSVRPMNGEVELMFFDAHRGELYSPSADVDDTYSLGGYSAGYLAAGPTLRCKQRSYSHAITIPTKHGNLSVTEDVDASHFDAGHKIVIVERDPADPASPTYWDRTIASVSGDDITLTVALSSPAWDATKKYRIISAPYTTATLNQQDDCYQADDADVLVQDSVAPYHFSVTDGGGLGFNANSSVSKAELLPNLSYGDGKPLDVGHDKALANTLNILYDYKTAIQNPFLWAELTTDSTTGGSNYYVVWAGMVFLGFTHYGSSMTRSVTLAPFFRSSNGASGSIRATLSRGCPMPGPGAEWGLSSPPRYPDAFSQAEWTTTSTSYAVGSDATLSCAAKDLHSGMAWLIIEKKGSAQMRGFAKFIQGPRVVR